LVPESSHEDRVVVMITSPLEAAHVERIADVDRQRVEVIYRPDLLLPPRYPADHHGPADWPGFRSRRAEWQKLLQRANVLWDFPLGEDRPLLELCPRLRWVQTTSAGVGMLVKRLGLQGTDLIVTTASGVHAGPLAEFVFAALLFHTKRFADLQSWQRAHHWERFASGELRGRVLAIVGPGRIGREVARIGRAFGMTIWAMAARYEASRAAELGVDRLFPRADLRTMLAGADAVVLCCPHTPETEGMIGPEELAALKRGVVFVNIARGAVVDEAALVRALREGRIAFAALDVFREEPLPPESPLWDLPNVLINPHSASTSIAENSRITDIFIQNLRHYLAGRFEEMAPRLDMQRLY
jgi:phosphoglycerate dehydrogenase-like enzyme